MSLSSVIQIAQNSLSNMTRRTGVLARNISEAGNENYARRELQSIALSAGAGTHDIRRITDLRLEKAALDASTTNAAQQQLSQHLEALNGLLAGDGPGSAVSDRLAALQDSLQTYSGSPQNTVLGQRAISSAKDLVASLNEATKIIQEFRSGVDQEIASAVNNLTSLLAAFKDANTIVRQGTQSGADVNDALDSRSAILGEIAKIVPVSSFNRADNDMVLITTSGATLFETEPRNLNFSAQTSLAPGITGNPVHVDVMMLKFANTPNSSASGSLDALLRLRDTIAPALQRQMDEIARSLVANFSERDVSGTMAPLQGLFAWSGGPAFPSAGSLIDGLAGDLHVNPAYDPEKGGAVERLRDGGANGASYLTNQSGGASYADRLIDLSMKFDDDQPYDASAGLGSDMSLLEFSSQSGGWFAGVRSSASQTAVFTEARHAVLKENLSNANGVNIDNEMARLGELEQGYEASARLLRAADQMLQDLLDAVGR